MTPDSILSEGYGNQREYIDKVVPLADSRQKQVEAAIYDSFAPFIETREVAVVVFEKMGATELAEAARGYWGAGEAGTKEYDSRSPLVLRNK
jgi:hypothetical protein